MGNFICDFGHVNKNPDPAGGRLKCSTCGGHLQTSPGIEALCVRYEARTFKVVECAFEEHTIQVKHGTVVKGPVEGVLLVVMPHDQLHALVSMSEKGGRRFIDNTIKTIKEAGWDGEVMIVADDMKMARFEVEER